MGRLTGKTAIITGGARGQGEATVRLFAAEGADVVFTDLLVEEGNALAQDLGKAVTFIAADITSEAAWPTLVQAAMDKTGRIDALVNNAAVTDHGKVLAMTRARLDFLLAVNVVAPYMGIQAVAPHMLQQKCGSIINISSVNGLRATQGMSAYDSCKWALRGLTKSVALEYGAQGIRANSIHPGTIRTPMLDPAGTLDGAWLAQQLRIVAGRVGEPDEVARVSLFLASDDSSYVNGAEIAVDGGWSAGVMVPESLNPESPENTGQS